MPTPYHDPPITSADRPAAAELDGGFATPYASIEPELVWDGMMGANTKRVFVATSSHQAYGGELLLEPDEVDDFVASELYPSEYSYNHDCQAALAVIEQALPDSEDGLAQAVTQAFQAKLRDLIAYDRRRQLDSATTASERIDLEHARRDFLFALKSIAAAFYLGDIPMGDDITADTKVWYDRGVRGRDGGYDVSYDTCSDTFAPDPEDNIAELDQIARNAEEWGGDELWPDEFHHPARLDIHVNPAKRIEFVYTPTVESARVRHFSHREVHGREGDATVFTNETLSMRLDLDPMAPNGLSLDIGRGSYDGYTSEGGYAKRQPDLVGSVFDKASKTSSHEFTGFKPGMADDFRSFAEQLAIRFQLQQKDVLQQQRERTLAEGTLAMIDRMLT